MQEAYRKAGIPSGLEVEVEFVDLVNGREYDLSEQATAEKFETQLRNGEFAALIVSPPCDTFSIVRYQPGGPGPLRGPGDKERYGRKHLPPQEKERVRLGTLLALRGLALMQIAHDKRIPWVCENPPEVHGEGAVYMLEEYRDFRRKCRPLQTVGANASWAPSR